ncbi:MAG TPA: TonB-dependent receptor [Pyrinomonadaceae bacterium]|nr:TonB-dependent receptor [Pyrinomonadaceae bacterium]
MNKIILFTALFLLTCMAAHAQNSGSIRGTVTSSINGSALHGATIEIKNLRRSVQTDDQGTYQFADVPAGTHTLVVHIEGFSDQTQTVTVTAAPVVADFSMSLVALREEVTVTATGTEESVFESFQSVNSVGSTQLREQAATGVGEILERESGVGKRSFGPGTSRPVIRGFDGDRVLVLQDGARNGSLASQSGDHGEPIDTLNLERLEVIKGPATLLYGSNAIGGVVNAVTNDEHDAHQGFRGNFTGLGATNNRQRGLSGAVEYGYKNFLFHNHGNFLREGDFRTPLGRIPNSASRSYGGTSSIGYYADKGFVVGSFSLDRRRYGVPYAPLFEEGSLLNADGQYDPFAIRDMFSRTLPEEPDEEIDLRMRRNNYRFRGGFRELKGPIRDGNFYIDFTKYRHEEIETADGVDEVATNFFNDTFSYRALFQHANYGKFSGRFGFEGFRRNYLTEGAEQLVDGRVRQNNFAVFALEEIGLDRIAFQLGARVETNRYNPENSARYVGRDFTGFSAAAAVKFRLAEGTSFIANVTSAYRAPALEELYNEGAHIGTVTFEIGDQGLARERSTGLELSLRQRVKRLRVNGSFFVYHIDNFIFLAPQDDDDDGNVDVEDNLPIGAYRQSNARFIGADITVDGDFRSWLGAFFVADIVKATLREADIPLPRITPARVRAGLDLRYKGLSVRPEAVFVGAKKADDIFSLETPTAGYGLFNLNASYTYATQHTAHTFSIATSNLTDRLYRNHLSFIKSLAPEAGRGARFSYTLRFF